LTPVEFRARTLPLLVAAVVLPIVGATLLIGAPGTFIAGAVVAAAIAVIAVRARFDAAIEVPASGDDRYHLLAVAMAAIDEPSTVEEIAAMAHHGASAVGAPADELADVLVLAPLDISSLDRWTSDVEGSREAARRRIAVSMGSLAAARLDAHGLVGDDDPVQAVEDALRTFPAHEVVFVTPRGAGEPAVAEVRRRLDRPVRHLEDGEAG
jgi:hypothetical protein